MWFLQDAILLGSAQKISSGPDRIKQIFFTAVQSGSIVWFRRPAFQATPQRGSLPHMGRAFTDIQEQKQVSCNISSSRFLRKQAFDHNILRGKVSIHPSRLKLLHALRLLEAHPLWERPWRASARRRSRAVWWWTWWPMMGGHHLHPSRTTRHFSQLFF